MIYRSLALEAEQVLNQRKNLGGRPRLSGRPVSWRKSEHRGRWIEKGVCARKA
jgi:hypothetical protein